MCFLRVSGRKGFPRIFGRSFYPPASVPGSALSAQGSMTEESGFPRKGKSFERGREAYHRRAVRIYQKTRIPDGLQSVGGGV